MTKEIYRGDFTNWKDVQDNFSTDTPEPDEVLVAEYSTGNYEGDATVIYRNGDKYYEVTGSHCSCYGLEGQWEPEEIKATIINEYLARKGY